MKSLGKCVTTKQIGCSWELLAILTGLRCKASSPTKTLHRLLCVRVLDSDTCAHEMSGDMVVM